MWFKKKSVLQADGNYDTEKSADGSTDLRTTRDSYTNTSSSIINSGLPSAADAGNYFYLPALSFYNSGQLDGCGREGFYWSSSANPENSNYAYYLRIAYGYVLVVYSYRYHGMRVEPTVE